MSTSLVNTVLPGQQLPMVPWRDPHSVSPGKLSEHIQRLETACLENPRSADLRTCLGMAYAVNYEVYKSMDALEAATAIDPTHFWAQLKYGELHYRLRALLRAEEETLKAVELAQNSLQLSLARKQLQGIRKLNRASIRNVTWDKPLTKPALVFAGMMLALFLVMVWK
jgi:tetratricopeptide (TPR) repeat protein